jgi:hypothetical protein
MMLLLVFLLCACITSAVDDVGRDRFAEEGFTVCQCDGMSTCQDFSMTKQDELFLCVFTQGMEIAGIESLTVHQGGLSLSPIVEGKKEKSTWVVMDTASRTQCTIRTRLDGDFFKPSFRGVRRNSLMVEGLVMMEDNGLVEFQMEIPLKSARLIDYVTQRSYVVAFCVLLFIAIGVWAVIVTMASGSRTRPTSFTQEKLAELEEKRFMEIYTIWYQSDRGKQGKESCSRTASTTSSRSSRCEEEEEKREIEPYDDEELASYMPSMYALHST